MIKSSMVFAVVLALGLGAYATQAVAAPPKPAKGPTEIEECGVIDESGSYVLVNNLTAIGDCLVVVTDFVSIDLQGFTITGDGPVLVNFNDPAVLEGAIPGTGTGIVDGQIPPQASDGITVRNGQITGFNIGINLGNGEGHVIEQVHAFVNSNIGIRVGQSSIVKDNTTHLNGYVGGLAELCGEECAGIRADCASIIVGNVIVNNFIDPIQIDLLLVNNTPTDGGLGLCVVVDNVFTPGSTPILQP